MKLWQVILLIVVVILLIWLFAAYLWPKLKKRGAKKTGQTDTETVSTEAALTEETSERVSEEIPRVVRSTGGASYEKLEPKEDLTLLADARKRFVAIDINTVGRIGQQEPVEISAVRYDNAVAGETFHSYIKPERLSDENLSDSASARTEALQYAPAHNAVFTELDAFLGDDLLAAYNAGFTARLLVDAYNKAGIARHFRCFDTLSMARVLYPELSNHKLRTVMDTVGCPSDEDTVGIAMILNHYIDQKGKPV